MAKKAYKDRDLKFETLQLHVGQETVMFQILNLCLCMLSLP